MWRKLKLRRKNSTRRILSKPASPATVISLNSIFVIQFKRFAGDEEKSNIGKCFTHCVGFFSSFDENRQTAVNSHRHNGNAYRRPKRSDNNFRLGSIKFRERSNKWKNYRIKLIPKWFSKHTPYCEQMWLLFAFGIFSPKIYLLSTQNKTANKKLWKCYVLLLTNRKPKKIKQNRSINYLI